MKVSKRLRSLLKSERGNVLVVVAACMPLIVGAAAIGVDTIQLTMTKRQLQRAADSAAMAGAYALVQSKTVADAVDRDLTLNNTNITLSAPRTVENAPTTGTYAGNTRAVRVVLAANRSTPFWAFFNRSSTPITVEATAESVFQGQFCMVSLINNNSIGITFTGSTDVNLGCGVATNSTSATAISTGGSARVVASPIAAVGGVPSSTGYASGTVLLPYSPKQADPYASLPRTPSPPASCTWINNLKVQPNDTLTIPAPASGNLCLSGGVDIKGTVTFPSNTAIYVDGGTLNLGSQANVTGDGVTFILTSSTPSISTSFANISMNGGAIVNLKAPSTGTYAGVLMYMDPRAPYGSDTINGNSASLFQGGLYFPTRSLTFNGNTGMTTNCLQLVAYQLTFSGNSSVNNTCPANSGAHAFDGFFVKLVA
jgi:Flp pilus assembly protein TadG